MMSKASKHILYYAAIPLFFSVFNAILTTFIDNHSNTLVHASNVGISSTNCLIGMLMIILAFYNDKHTTHSYALQTFCLGIIGIMIVVLGALIAVSVLCTNIDKTTAIFLGTAAILMCISGGEAVLCIAMEYRNLYYKSKKADAYFTKLANDIAEEIIFGTDRFTHDDIAALLVEKDLLSNYDHDAFRQMVYDTVKRLLPMGHDIDGQYYAKAINDWSNYDSLVKHDEKVFNVENF